MTLASNTSVACSTCILRASMPSTYSAPACSASSDQNPAFEPRSSTRRPRRVALIGVHNSDGAMGVVLNRPSAVTVGEAVPQLEPAVSEEEPVYLGGPVQPGSVVLLAEFLDPAQAGLFVLGRIGFPAADAD